MRDLNRLGRAPVSGLVANDLPPTNGNYDRRHFRARPGRRQAG